MARWSRSLFCLCAPETRAMLRANIQLSLLKFLIRYRRTALGPVWLLVGPSLFIALLGNLYAHIGAAEASVFVPHLAIGLVAWTLIQGFVNGSATIFPRNRAQIMQGGQSLDGIVWQDVATTVLSFFHQLPIIIAVFVIYRLPINWSALLSLAGLALVIANGVWVTRVFGILGARYRDLSEVFHAVMRIAFLATPIIWMPGQGLQGGVMGHFLVYNPFVHYLDIIRAPLLGQPVALLSWGVVLAFTVAGFFLAQVMTARFGRFVPLWV